MKTAKRFLRNRASAFTNKVDNKTTEENKSLNYSEQFLREPDVKARAGKLVYVRKEHHECIQRIIQTIGENNTSIYAFLDNVIEEHFNLHRAEIEELYRETCHKSVFNH